MRRTVFRLILVLSLLLLGGCAAQDGAESALDASDSPALPDLADTPVISVVTAAVPTKTKDGTVLSYGAGWLLLRLSDGAALSLDTTAYTGAAALPGDVVEIAYTEQTQGERFLSSLDVITRNEAIVSGVIVLADPARIYVQTAEDDVFGFIVDERTETAGAVTELGQDDLVHVVYEGNLNDAPRAAIISVLSQALHTASPAPNERTKEQKTLAGQVTAISSKGFRIACDAGDAYIFSFGKETKITGRYNLAVGARVIVSYHGLASRKPLAETIQVITAHVPPSSSPDATPVPTPRGAQDTEYEGTVVSFADNRLKATSKDKTMEFRTGDANFDIQYYNGEPVANGKPAAGDKIYIRYFVLSGVNYASYLQIIKPLPTPHPAGDLNAVYVRHTPDKKSMIVADAADLSIGYEINLTKMTGEIEFYDKDGKKIEETLKENDNLRIAYEMIDDVRYAIKINAMKPDPESAAG